MTLRLWLVRHAQSTWNQAQRIQGWANPPLSELGKWQAQQVAKRLSSVTFTALYTSSAQRATQTAQAIADMIDLAPQSDERLREVGIGEATGYRWEEVMEHWPHLQEIAAQGRSVWPHIPGAETPQVFQERVGAAFKEIIAEHSEGVVAVVTHGGTLRMYLSTLFEAPTLLQGLHLSNASLTLLVLNTIGHARLHSLNDTCHLHTESIGEVI